MESIISLQQIKDQLGDYAKDVKINLSNILEEKNSPGLKLNQIWGVALSSSYATKSLELCQKMKQLAKAHLSEEEMEATRSAASIMAMNNVYYRFVHLSDDKEFLNMPAKLRMLVIGNPGIEKTDFELYSIAISAIEGCGMCINSHAEVLKRAGLPSEAIQSAIRIASVMNSVAQSLFIKQVEG